MPTPPTPANPQKQRTGLSRVWHATGYSWAGLRAGWGETAFRQEAIAAIVLVPLAAAVLAERWMEAHPTSEGFRDTMAWWPVLQK